MATPFPVSLVGSMPGEDVREVVRIVAGELPDLPILPELPARGPGADMLGRTLSLLSLTSSEFAATTTTTGWRLTGSVSGAMPRTMRLGQSWLGEDLDACEEAFTGFAGHIKIALAGPFTVAAAVELPTGEPMLSDRGALRALVAVTHAVTADLASELTRRIPGVEIVVQYDEPLLDRVLAGKVSTQSGMSRIFVDQVVLAAQLQELAQQTITRVRAVGVHSCASRAPVPALVAAGFDFISLDWVKIMAAQEAPRREAEDLIAQFLESGGTALVGLNEQDRGVAQRLDPLTEFCDRTGVNATDMATQFILTPRCGLAGATHLDSVRSAIANLGDAQRALSGLDVGGREDS